MKKRKENYLQKIKKKKKKQKGRFSMVMIVNCHVIVCNNMIIICHVMC